MWFPLAISVAVVVLVQPALSQYFPPTPEDLRTVSLKNGLSISYKQTTICEATPGVRAYAGYVHLPPGTLEDVGVYQNYSINTFFWFFEAREDPINAPIAIFLNGGPGSSSMFGLFQENGPCTVNHDSNSTTLNPWSWNRNVNMLYVDQPVQTGFSYDKLVNVTVELVSGNIMVKDFSNGVPVQNNTFWVGSYPSQIPQNTANNTLNAARAFWHFSQAWFQGFPQYKPTNSKISIWAESYGGKYGPSFARFLLEQNRKIEEGTIGHEDGKMVIHIDTLGIISGCIDIFSQILTYPEFTRNNTYGIEAVNNSTYEAMIDTYHKSGGCAEQLQHCRRLTYEGDLTHDGSNATVNEACRNASQACVGVEEPYSSTSGRGYYDIAHPRADPFPPPFFQGYLNRPHVQADLGVPLNFTSGSLAVYRAFNTTGDYVSPGAHGYTNDIGYLLESGVNVAMIYGDRDYSCNWVGGENTSLSIKYSNSSRFRAAGYSDIRTNSSYVGGQVRQYGSFSFSRVYQAGHMVPAYQPETAFEIFRRVMFDMDIATGKVNTMIDKAYSTKGQRTTFQIKNEPPPMPKPTCYILAPSSCTDDQVAVVVNGSGLILDYILIDENTKHLFPDIKFPTPSSAGSTPTSTAKKATAARTELGNGSLSVYMVLLVLFLLLVK
ncbi:carboxypeptidase [Histoplasma capsulatum G186AR]|uniref:Carboxypeptidase n=2 Tax=Ajellomyces capsulatus TaxID=5037 RepID=C0NQW5_AJECG|nr:carboxypeptidase [Histoplasma capsulatum G186AR]EEH06079.1 carboxypeptidase [Histoplasma capsulatum G186AR]KAG5293463.1 carboxypeptidase [Histoplasma capsulatum]QSS74913.1 carboxypeptidase [Histoplasma capsulatum G186AR]